MAKEKVTVDSKKMMKKYFSFNSNHFGRFGTVLTLSPFVIMFFAYMIASYMRLSENPLDKLMPSFWSMAKAFYEIAFTRNERTDSVLLVVDWLSSMKRLLLGVSFAAVTGTLIGLMAGLFPFFKKLIMPFVTVLSIIPPLALLPILFICFGTDEIGKIVLIYFGTAWIFTRDIYQYIVAIPDEQLIKGLTLGASQSRIAYGIILPQVYPKLISSLRLNLGSAWLFLIAAEAIASTDGLGYRIFLVRRYMSMDIIIPYVIVIVLTGYLMDLALRKFSNWLFPWYTATQDRK